MPTRNSAWFKATRSRKRKPKSHCREASVDGGKVHLRTPLGEPSIWRDYKAVDTEPGMVTMLGNNLGLIDWLKAQP